jgi:ribosomal protein S3AE
MKIFSNDKNELEVKSSPLYQPRSNFTIGNYTFLTQHQYSNELLLQKKINTHQRMLHFTAIQNIQETSLESVKTTNEIQTPNEVVEDEVTNEFEDIVMLKIEKPTKKIEPFANVKIKRDELISEIGEDKYNKFKEAGNIVDFA